MGMKLQEWRPRLELALIAAGIGIASYLTYVKLFGLKPYCAGVGNCDAVQNSAYAEFFGIPVAVLGLATYVALLALWWVKRSNWQGLGSLAGMGFFFVSLVGVLFSAYLTYLEIWVIKEICPWCVASAIVMTLVFLLSVTELLSGAEDNADVAVLQTSQVRRRK